MLIEFQCSQQPHGQSTFFFAAPKDHPASILSCLSENSTDRKNLKEFPEEYCKRKHLSDGVISGLRPKFLLIACPAPRPCPVVLCHLFWGLLQNLLQNTLRCTAKEDTFLHEQSVGSASFPQGGNFGLCIT